MPQNKSPQVERKHFFINSLVQGRLMARFVAYWVVYHLVLWHTLFLYRYFQYRFELMMGEPPQTFMELYGAFCSQYYPIALSAIAVLPLLLWDMLKLSHRVVGPLVPMQRALEKMTRGERVEEVIFRDGDMLTEFGTTFNKFLIHYNERLRCQEDTDIKDSELFAAPTEDELKSQVDELARTAQQFNLSFETEPESVESESSK
ncbi:MAG: hypothetical protein R3C18_08670 [Planctomycetaceae bacterium]